MPYHLKPTYFLRQQRDFFFNPTYHFIFFPIWLHDINHISKSDTGIIFAA
ncbi:MFS transporter, partial [Escherichia coli]